MNELKSNVYKKDEWRLFNDSSKRSLKAVPLHIGSKYASITRAHSNKFEENYESIKYVLEKVNYAAYEWQL